MPPLRLTVERICQQQLPVSELEAHLARGLAAEDDASGGTPLLIAAHYGRADCVELLLASGASANFEGRTEVNLTNRGTAAALDRWRKGSVSPLYVSAQEGHPECVSILLIAGADPNFAHTKDGSTPLYVSCGAGHSDCAIRLSSAGAFVNKIRDRSAASTSCELIGKSSTSSGARFIQYF